MTRKGLTYLFLTVLMVAVVCGCEKRKDEFITNAQEYLDNGKYMEARLELRNALAMDPECGPCRTMMGDIFMREGNGNGAYSNYSMAVKINPNDLQAQLGLANLLLMAGKPEQADEKIRLILFKDPDNLEAKLIETRILLNKDDLDKAFEVASQTVSSNPDSIDAALILSQVYIKKDQSDKAIELLEKNVTKPGGDRLFLPLAQLFAKEKDLASAEKYYRMLINSNPESTDYKYALVDFFLTSKQAEKAKEMLTDMVAANPEDATAIISLSQVTFSLGDKREALAVLQKGIEVDPDTYELRFALASLYRSTGDWKKSIEELNEIIAMDPENSQSVTAGKTLADIYFEHNMPDKALKELDIVLVKNPRDPDAYMLRGKIYVLQGRGAKAVAAFRQVVKDYPKNAQVLVMLARAHILNNEYGLAVETLKDALSVDSAYVPAREALVDVYLSRGEWYQAIMELNRLMASNPGNLEIMSRIGDIYLMRGDFKMAEEKYMDLVRMKPTDPLGYLKLAKMETERDRCSKAVTYYEKALEIKPGSIQAIEGIVDCDLARSMFTRANKFISGIEKQYPESAYVYEIKARIEIKRGVYDMARKDYLKAINLQPEWLIPYLGLADVFFTTNDINAGIDFFTALSKDEGKSVPSHLVLGLMYERKGKYQQAEENYKDILENNPGFIPAANNLAYLYATRFPKEVFLDKALELAHTAAYKGNPDALDTLGYIMYLKGEYAGAVQALNQAVLAKPDFTTAMYHLALAYEKMGEISSAKLTLEKALKLKKSFPERKAAETLLNKLGE